MHWAQDSVGWEWVWSGLCGWRQHMWPQFVASVLCGISTPLDEKSLNVICQLHQGKSFGLCVLGIGADPSIDRFEDMMNRDGRDLGDIPTNATWVVIASNRTWLIPQIVRTAILDG